MVSETAPYALILGDACVDLIVQVPTIAGNAAQQAEPELHGGGTGANTAVGLARLGVPTVLMGAVGDDGYGRFTLDSLNAEGINTSHTHAVGDAFTTITLALIDAQGERTLHGWPRRGAAHTRFAEKHVDVQVIEQASWVHTTGMCLVEPPACTTILHCLSIASAAQIPISFDLNLRLGFEDGDFPELFRQTICDTIALSTYVLGSADEEYIYLGSPDSNLSQTVQELADNQRTVIARLGADGALVTTPDHVTTIIPAFEVDVVDTLGAGDAFNAGFIAACLEGRSVTEAVQWGSAVAALKIGKPGARSTPSRIEVEALLNNESMRTSF